jgi:hypothetical protein
LHALLQRVALDAPLWPRSILGQRRIIIAGEEHMVEQEKTQARSIATARALSRRRRLRGIRTEFVLGLARGMATALGSALVSALVWWIARR